MSDNEGERAAYVPMQIMVHHDVVESCGEQFSVQLEALASCPFTYARCPKDQEYCGRQYSSTCVAGFCGENYCPVGQNFSSQVFGQFIAR
jgi:hypothetical protein